MFTDVLHVFAAILAAIFNWRSLVLPTQKINNQLYIFLNLEDFCVDYILGVLRYNANNKFSYYFFSGLVYFHVSKNVYAHSFAVLLMNNNCLFFGRFFIVWWLLLKFYYGHTGYYTALWLFTKLWGLIL